MNPKIKLVVLCLMLIQFAAQAQDYPFKNYTWATQIPKYVLSEEDAKYGEICIEEKKAVEFTIEDKGAYQYYLWHNITLLNSSDAIERNNTIRIPFSENTELLINKLRVILPDGKIIELTNEDIKEAQDEKEAKKYQYYAVKGLVIGALIERIVLRKMIPQVTGMSLDLQSDYPSKWQQFELIYPSYLVFQTKTYNIREQQFIIDSSDSEKTRQYIQLENVAALQEEKYSNYNASLKSIAYKMTGNHRTGIMDLFSYSQVVQKIYPIMNPVLSKSDLKLISKFLAASNINSITNEEDKIREVESYVKSNILCGEDVTIVNRDLATIFKNKVTDYFGMVKLFCCIYNYLGIDHQEVLTTDRFEEKFDSTFENQNHLNNYLMYFPSYKYIAPTELLSRYPYIPYQYTDNYALFIKPLRIENVFTGIGEIKKIPALDYSASIDTMIINIDFTTDMSKPCVSYEVSWSGYIAERIQPYMQLVEEKEKEKLRKELLSGFTGDLTNVSVKTSNEGIEYFGKASFKASCTTTNQNLMEKVGDTYLFKLGDLIGKQEEMYQQGSRQTVISIPYSHVYYRIIRMQIPEGYVLKNTDKININKVCTLDNQIACQFITNYQTEKNMLNISNEESYRILDLPISSYDSFKSVINAAADFNKIVLILEPK